MNAVVCPPLYCERCLRQRGFSRLTTEWLTLILEWGLGGLSRRRVNSLPSCRDMYPLAATIDVTSRPPRAIVGPVFPQGRGEVDSAFEEVTMVLGLLSLSRTTMILSARRCSRPSYSSFDREDGLLLPILESSSHSDLTRRAP